MSARKGYDWSVESRSINWDLPGRIIAQKYGVADSVVSEARKLYGRPQKPLSRESLPGMVGELVMVEIPDHDRKTQISGRLSDIGENQYRVAVFGDHEGAACIEFEAGSVDLIKSAGKLLVIKLLKRGRRKA